jgi:uncharacterized protein YndB with AHSA1/START domain
MTALTLTRVFDAPAERVFAAFTEPAALAAWFWPDAFATTATTDPRSGGRFRIASAPNDMAVSGVYREVDPPRRLAFTWRWDGEDDETMVTIDFTARGDKTEIVLRHGPFADDQTRDDHATGWSDCLDRLPDRLATDAQRAG